MPSGETDGIDLFVRIRSTRPPAPARLTGGADGLPVVELLAGEDGVSPGQACVFYAGEGEGAQVLGGGVIARTERAAMPAVGAESLVA